jgi:AmmeMemoRadiSam system protein B
VSVRPAAVAGAFYPADPHRLRADVERFLLEAEPPDSPRAPKALVAPHAGYAYSGPIAASAFRTLDGHEGAIRRVVLLGPSHFVPLAGCALPAWTRFATPLGEIEVDVDARAALADGRVGEPAVEVADRPHAREHSLEVELPFLQVVLDEFTLVPLAVGDATPDHVARVLELLWGGGETLIVVSTDLSHYLDAASAERRDQATAAAIVALDADRIGPDDACGRHPLRGLLTAARRRGLGVTELDLRHSGDTAGDRERVVGYGAFAFG